MNVKVLKTTFLGLFTLLTAVSASASSFASEEELDGCYTALLHGPKSTDVIKISALPGEGKANQCVGLIDLPNDKSVIARWFKYLVSDLEEGCFGVVERFVYNGRNYGHASVVVTLNVSSMNGVTVTYSVSAGDDTIISGSFPLTRITYSDLERNSYTDDDWAVCYNNFNYWMEQHIEEYKE